jgi:hypothetical protein
VPFFLSASKRSDTWRSLRSSGLAIGRGLWETRRMAETPKLVRVDANTYKCSVCENFQVVINPNKKLNAGQVQAQIAKREAEHLRKVHSDEDFGKP